jgi:hypothetical protein
LIYQQSIHFKHLDLKKVDQQRNFLLVIEMTNIVKDRGHKNGYKNFIDQVMVNAYAQFNNKFPLIILVECKASLQLGQ